MRQRFVCSGSIDTESWLGPDGHRHAIIVSGPNIAPLRLFEDRDIGLTLPGALRPVEAVTVRMLVRRKWRIAVRALAMSCKS